MQRNPSFTKRPWPQSTTSSTPPGSGPPGKGFEGATFAVVRPPALAIGDDLAAWDRLEHEDARRARGAQRLRQGAGAMNGLHAATRAM